MAKQKRYATSSYSMPPGLHARLKQRLPRHGDASRLVTRLIEMWLNNEVVVQGLYLKSRQAQSFQQVIYGQQTSL